MAAALIRRRYLRWGATEAERRAVLPGDELMAVADLVVTRAISTSAAPEMVWPWIAQLGQGRGGFYSYNFLENTVGYDMHSASQVHPEWQAVVPGAEVRLAPQVPLVVAAAEPGAALVLRGIKKRAESARPQSIGHAERHRYRPQRDSFADLDQQADTVAHLDPHPAERSTGWLNSGASSTRFLPGLAVRFGQRRKGDR